MDEYKKAWVKWGFPATTSKKSTPLGCAWLPMGGTGPPSNDFSESERHQLNGGATPHRKQQC